jgi:trk system potassium uptake protein
MIGKVRQVTLTTKIILWGTLWLTVLGTSLLFLNEPTLQGLAPQKRLLAAFFQCMSAMTTVGFNTVNIADLSKASLLLTIVLMVIGSSPSGTGGGVKITTVSAMFGVIRSIIRNEKEVRFWGRAIPYERVTAAFAGLGFYLAGLIVGTYLLELTESTPFEKNFFEAASALGTVGLSMGITATLSVMGKVIIILLMFLGRVSPLTFGSAIFGRVFNAPQAEVRDSDLAVCPRRQTIKKGTQYLCFRPF